MNFSNLPQNIKDDCATAAQDAYHRVKPGGYIGGNESSRQQEMVNATLKVLVPYIMQPEVIARHYADTYCNNREVAWECIYFEVLEKLEAMQRTERNP